MWKCARQGWTSIGPREHPTEPQWLVNALLSLSKRNWTTSYKRSIVWPSTTRKHEHSALSNTSMIHHPHLDLSCLDVGNISSRKLRQGPSFSKEANLRPGYSPTSEQENPSRPLHIRTCHPNSSCDSQTFV